MYIPEKISEKEIYSNPWRKILEKTIKTKTGSEQSFPISSHVGPKFATMVFPITNNGEVIFNKEWRPGIEGFVYNFPVGMQEAGLSFEENTSKELKEEVGCTTKNIIYLGESIIANFDDTIIKYFVALDCELGENDLEDGEHIEVQKCSISDFEKKIIAGKINCPLTMSCFTLAKLKNLL